MQPSKQAKARPWLSALGQGVPGVMAMIMALGSIGTLWDSWPFAWDRLFADHADCVTRHSGVGGGNGGSGEQRADLQWDDVWTQQPVCWAKAMLCCCFACPLGGEWAPWLLWALELLNVAVEWLWPVHDTARQCTCSGTSAVMPHGVICRSMSEWVGMWAAGACPCAAGCRPSRQFLRMPVLARIASLIHWAVPPWLGLRSCAMRYLSSQRALARCSWVVLWGRAQRLAPRWAVTTVLSLVWQACVATTRAQRITPLCAWSKNYPPRGQAAASEPGNRLKLKWCRTCGQPSGSPARECVQLPKSPRVEAFFLAT